MPVGSPGWLKWLTGYRREDLSSDLLAGVVVSIMLVPQAMAYALLAGLPPEIGLYAALAAAFVYPLIGSSRYLAVGPVAIVSLLVATGVAALSPSSSAEYIGYAVQLALLVGLLQLLLGVVRLGFLVNFASHAVLAGFTTAAALVIGLNQVKLLLGISIPRTANSLQLVESLITQIPQSKPATVVLGLGSLVVLWLFSSPLEAWFRSTRVPDRWIVPITKSAPLLVVGMGAGVVTALSLGGEHGVATIGSIPSGLPALRLPSLSIEGWSLLLPTALAITFVGFAESYAVAKTLASKRREKIVANRELIALGAANVAASVAGGYPVTGGFSRSVVNFSAGARTGAASLISTAILVVTIVLLTPMFESIPHAVLAAIIVVAVTKLVDFRSLARLWTYCRTDAVAYLATFAAVLLFGVQIGILSGIAIAIAIHLWRTSRPHFAMVGRVGETEHYRNVLRHDVETEPHVLAVRVDESLYFANTANLEERILAMVAERPEVRELILIASAVNFIDGSALETLERLVDELHEGGVRLHLAEVKGPVMDRLSRVGFPGKLGRGQVFLTTHQALQALSDPHASGSPIAASGRASWYGALRESLQNTSTTVL